MHNSWDILCCAHNFFIVGTVYSTVICTEFKRCIICKFCMLRVPCAIIIQQFVPHSLVEAVLKLQDLNAWVWVNNVYVYSYTRGSCHLVAIAGTTILVPYHPWQIRVAHLKSRYQMTKSTGYLSSNKRQWFDYMRRYPFSSTSWGHQDDMPYYNFISLLPWEGLYISF